VWKRLEHNPLLLLLLIGGTVGTTEGMARLVDLLLDAVFDPDLGYLLSAVGFHALSFGATFVVYILSTAGALLVVLHEESFFGDARAFSPRRFWQWAFISWLIILILPGAVSTGLGFVTSFARFVMPSTELLIAWYLLCSLIVAMLQAFLASLLLWRLPAYSVRTAPGLVIERPRGLFITYAILFVTVTMLAFGIWYVAGMDFAALATLRIKFASEVIIALLASLAAFVAVQRSNAVDKPSIISLFE
jgi:hypothetical protein